MESGLNGDRTERLGFFMPKINLRERIRQGPRPFDHAQGRLAGTPGVFLLDGAMGTELFARGIEAGVCNDYLNIESPNLILDIHRAYLSAGSDAVLTNTFGANKYALARHGLADRITEINNAGARIARRAAGEEKYVLGDIGPSGDFLEPLGNLKPAELKDAFAQQAKALLDGGVDGFIIETMAALDEVEIAIEAVKLVSDDLPVLASMAFDRAGNDFKTMMGIDVKSAISKIFSLDVDVLGFNCGTLSLDDYVELAKEYVSIVRNLSIEAAIFSEPNAGKPELVDGKVIYKVTPEDFAAAAEKIHSAGVNTIGGCCGTGPEHIRALAETIKK
jgi:methionine synthase I (cobalamin-dependent)